ncbi:uncharacterized protein LOC110268069 [Arachis ipaensis]|uniref:uncharacterized protein LOC110268069 n=1 Tax=Arachis ipaensis TaxID=130454 RepID=UPI000A2B49BC|nr:uncharacterized protein LOC110268069 [Arachis ipaensis]
MNMMHCSSVVAVPAAIEGGENRFRRYDGSRSGGPSGGLPSHSHSSYASSSSMRRRRKNDEETCCIINHCNFFFREPRKILLPLAWAELKRVNMQLIFMPGYPCYKPSPFASPFCMALNHYLNVIHWKCL